jgi:hypothetical protein
MPTNTGIVRSIALQAWEQTFAGPTQAVLAERIKRLGCYLRHANDTFRILGHGELGTSADG